MARPALPAWSPAMSANRGSTWSAARRCRFRCSGSCSSSSSATSRESDTLPGIAPAGPGAVGGLPRRPGSPDAPQGLALRLLVDPRRRAPDRRCPPPAPPPRVRPSVFRQIPREPPPVQIESPGDLVRARVGFGHAAPQLASHLVHEPGFAFLVASLRAPAARVRSASAPRADRRARSGAATDGRPRAEVRDEERRRAASARCGRGCRATASKSMSGGGVGATTAPSGRPAECRRCRRRTRSRCPR